MKQTAQAEHAQPEEWLSSRVAAEQLRKRYCNGETIAFVSGNFNVIHPGHLRLLKFAAENSDVLVVGLNPDGPSSITVPALMRMEALDAVKMVDHAVLLDQPLVEFIDALKPDKIVKGNEHKGGVNIEVQAAEAYGGRLLFAPGDVTFSSLNLLQTEVEDNDHHTVKPRDFLARHNFSLLQLMHTLHKISNVRVLVIGDLILDAYINCEPIGMSQEDPTIVVTPIDESLFVGGAGIVAAHARGLGAKVKFLTVVGKDEKAAFAHEELDKYGVDADFLVDPTRPTTLKQRYRAHGKTLLRVNQLHQHSIDTDLTQTMIDKVESALDVDLILFSDFNYGCLPQPVVDAVSEMARAKGIMMAADSQASSQFADVSRFKGMTLLTPTEREARLGIQDFESGLARVSQKLQQAAEARHVIVTLGAAGALIRSQKDGEPHTDRLPVFNPTPVDVAGAGDSLFTSTSLALCAGADIWQSVYLGCIAAGCQVARVGNKPLTVQELQEEIAHPN